MSVSETLETIALFEQLAPFAHAQGPNVVWKEFDPSPRKFTDMGMDIEYNYSIPTRDGIKLRGDIYLPQTRSKDAKLPVVLVYTPFGKQKAFDVTQIPPSREFDAGFDGVHFSKHAPFEGSDPYFWTTQGFAYVVVDARGSYASEGVFYTMVSKLDGLDAYDTIEYLGTRAWSNGCVGMVGASGLGAVQWLAAANRPPHLCGIMVQDAFTDFYREVAFKGGVYHGNFIDDLTKVYCPHGNAEKSLMVSLPQACQKYPHYNDFWRLYTADIEKIECPVYLITSLADNGVHTPGSIRGYVAAKSKVKYLEMHPYKKWEWQLTAESLERQAAFFHKVLHGRDVIQAKSVDFWPPVRLHVTEKHYAGSWRSENEFPIARTERRKFFLGQDGKLVNTSLSGQASATYDAKKGTTSWKMVFTEPTEITGTCRLHLIFSASASDADLFVTLQKLDRQGNIVHFPYHTFIDDGHVAWGWLRASKRKLAPRGLGDEVRHTHLEEDIQPLVPEQKVELDISIQPSATLFRAGEALVVAVQGHDFNEYSPQCQVPRAGTGCNDGQHSIFLEGSYLESPIVPYKFA